MREMRRVAVAVGIAFAVAAALPAIADADTTLGSASMPAGSGPRGCNDQVIAQLTSDPSTPYTVPSPSTGALTAWQVNTAGSASGTPVMLVVLRAVDASNYTVVGTDTQTLPSSPPSGIATFTVPAPIAVTGGEILALYSPGNAFTCYFRDGATPPADSLISLDSAGPITGQSLTRQDTSPGGFTLNLAATLTSPVPKKKCKKHKKKRSADSAKKKKCKKKKKG
jgi:hypothetical protein